MPSFTSHAPNSPSWVDLMSPDVDASVAFYSAVFGWESADEHDDDGNRIYTMFRQDGKAVAGLGAQPPHMAGMPGFWNSYVAVDDPQATVDAAVAAGGSVMMPPMEVMGAGEMAVLADPTGAAISLWRPMSHTGAEIANEPNTWSWNELLTRDKDAAMPFYSAVFGWSYQEQDMGGGMTYTVIEGGENGGLGGIMPMPAEVPDFVPNHWGVYFATDDLAAKVAAVTANGGTVSAEPFEVPGVGSMAVLADPGGATFTLMQSLAE